MEIKENQIMETLRKQAKERLDIERSENENVLIREINDLIFSLKENSGRKTIVEALVEFLEKKFVIFRDKFLTVKSMADSASRALLENEKSRFHPATEYDKNTNTLLMNPVGSAFREVDKKRNEEYLKNFFKEGSDIKGFDEMNDSEKALAILDKNIAELKNNEDHKESENQPEEKKIKNQKSKNKSKKVSK